jgi:hypothetical protein
MFIRVSSFLLSRAPTEQEVKETDAMVVLFRVAACLKKIQPISPNLNASFDLIEAGGFETLVRKPTPPSQHIRPESGVVRF